ncbi:MAG: hypothetical protein ACI9BW_003934 [Gammaproteobacteria bacterium]|jgi:hypothetical protein
MMTAGLVAQTKSEVVTANASLKREWGRLLSSGSFAISDRMNVLARQLDRASDGNDLRDGRATATRGDYAE